MAFVLRTGVRAISPLKLLLQVGAIEIRVLLRQSC